MSASYHIGGRGSFKVSVRQGAPRTGCPRPGTAANPWAKRNRPGVGRGGFMSQTTRCRSSLRSVSPSLTGLSHNPVSSVPRPEFPSSPTAAAVRRNLRRCVMTVGSVGGREPLRTNPKFELHRRWGASTLTRGERFVLADASAPTNRNMTAKSCPVPLQCPSLRAGFRRRALFRGTVQTSQGCECSDGPRPPASIPFTRPNTDQDGGVITDGHAYGIS